MQAIITANMEGKISTGLGLIAGFLLKMSGTELMLAIGVAFMTGGAAYLGQVIVQLVIHKIEEKFKIKLSIKRKSKP